MRLEQRSVRKPSGFGRVMAGLTEAQAKEEYSSRLNERQEHVNRLKEKFEKADGLALGGGTLDKLFESDPKKAENLLLFLENTEAGALTNRTLVENMKQAQLNEAVQTSGFLGITPQDVVKISRIAYPNSHATDIFDFWGMTSMKDTLFKLETLVGSTARGSDANDVVVEKYGEGRYPSEWEEFDVVTSANTTFIGTLDYYPVRQFKVEVYLNNAQVGADNGAGVIVGSTLNASGVNTINYANGDFSIQFTNAITSNDELIVRYSYDSEQESRYTRTGSVLLNLVAYDYRATMYPLAIEWTRFTEELMASKVGMSAKEQLIQGAADMFRKSLDEMCIDRGIKASNWSTAVTFDADFAAAGSDSPIDHAQGIISAIMAAEMKPYNTLGRQADKTNLVVDTAAFIYLTKHKQFQATTPGSKVGVYKGGELMGRSIYVCPPNIITPVANKGFIYDFGKSADGLSVDSPVSVGTWKASIVTDPVELKNFNSQMGMAAMLDIKTNNRNFANKVEIVNLTPN